MSAAQLAVTILALNALTFGNGPALVPLLQARFVEEDRLLTVDQLLYALAIARVTPGPANVYVAAVGYFLLGLPGAIVTMVAIQLPGYLILPLTRLHVHLRDIAVVQRFTRGLTATSVGLIFAAVASLGRETLTTIPAGIVCALTFALVHLLKWHPILGLAVATLAGLALHFAT